MSACERSVARLDGFHDGELGWLTRWRLGRHLERCSGCSSELRRLQQVSDWVRSEAGGEAPDLWADLQRRLPDLDREIEAVMLPARSPRLPRFALPLGAGVAVATAAVALTLFWPRPATTGTGVVRSLYAPTQPVMVLEDSDESTIIWVLDSSPDERSGEVRHALG